MKLKNIYILGMHLSIFFAVFPLLFFAIANIMSYLIGCGIVWTPEMLESCIGGERIVSLYVFSWFVIVSIPIGSIFFITFYLLYLSVRRR